MKALLAQRCNYKIAAKEQEVQQMKRLDTIKEEDSKELRFNSKDEIQVHHDDNGSIAEDISSVKLDDVSLQQDSVIEKSAGHNPPVVAEVSKGKKNKLNRFNRIKRKQQNGQKRELMNLFTAEQTGL